VKITVQIDMPQTPDDAIADALSASARELADDLGAEEHDVRERRENPPGAYSITVHAVRTADDPEPARTTAKRPTRRATR
jgi:hypothetical protein